ncbi:MAG: hypothetical protein ABL967_13430 [Bryobacteraceae bacterium]
MAKAKPMYDHSLQLRLLSSTVAEIDEAILSYQTLSAFSRSEFIRNAIRYVLYNLENDPVARNDMTK